MNCSKVNFVSKEHNLWPLRVMNIFSDILLDMSNSRTILIGIPITIHPSSGVSNSNTILIVIPMTIQPSYEGSDQALFTHAFCTFTQLSFGTRPMYNEFKLSPALIQLHHNNRTY